MENSRRSRLDTVPSVGQIAGHVEETRRFVGTLEVAPEIHELPRLIAREGGRGDPEEGFGGTPDVLIEKRRIGGD